MQAFLKDYGYVKEYGEGVDRMCQELEALGLPDPVFDTSTFILKTTIQSASYHKKTVYETVADSIKNLPFESTKFADSAENLPVEDINAADLNQKLPAIVYVAAMESLGYSEPTRENLKKIYTLLETNQIFGSAYIRRNLNCSERTA